MEPKRRRKAPPVPFVLVAAGGLLLAAVIISLGNGAGSLGLAGLPAALGEPGSTGGRILYHVRLPRTLATVLAGAGLAVAGVITQAVLENPLASPGIIGVNAGAGFATILCTALFPAATSLIPGAAFLGAFCAVLLVYGVARRAGASRATLILSGVALSSLLNAGIDAVSTLAPDALTGTNTFRVGGVQGVTMGKLMPAGWLIVGAVLLVILMAGELDVLGLGELTAKSLGLNTGAYRFVFLLLAAVLAGASVSFAGLLGFVGLMVPHIARLFVGNGSRGLLGVSALGGAAFLTFCDVISRTAFSPYELPVGIFVSLLGTPFFLFLLFRRKKGASHD